MKRIESIRQSEGKGIVVRLLQQPYDGKWVKFGDIIKKYVVVRYNSDQDKYIPHKDINKKHWDSITYDELSIDTIGSNKEKHKQRMDKCKTKIRDAVGTKKYFSDNFLIAQNIYIEWSNTYCGVTRNPWTPTQIGD